MKFELDFKMGNAAFETDRQAEAARILRSIADLLDNGLSEAPIHDGNGNTVGDWAIFGERGE